MGIVEFITLVLLVLFFLCLGALIKMVYIEKTKIIYGAYYTNKYTNVYVEEVVDGDVVFMDEYDEKHKMSIERFTNQFTILPPDYNTL